MIDNKIDGSGEITLPPYYEILDCINAIANDIKRILSLDKVIFDKTPDLLTLVKLDQNNWSTNPIGQDKSFCELDLLKFILDWIQNIIDEKRKIIIYFLLKNDFAHIGIFKSKFKMKDINIVQYVRSQLFQQGIIQDATDEEIKNYISQLPKGHVNVKNVFKFTPLARSFYHMIGEEIFEKKMPEWMIEKTRNWKKESDTINIPKKNNSHVIEILTKEKNIEESYNLLEKLAIQRDYQEIGFGKAVHLLRINIGVSEKKAREILKILASDPYRYIKVDKGQIYVESRESINNNSTTL